jgi:hypothetical protein
MAGFVTSSAAPRQPRRTGTRRRVDRNSIIRLRSALENGVVAHALRRRTQACGVHHRVNALRFFRATPKWHGYFVTNPDMLTVIFTLGCGTLPVPRDSGSTVAIPTSGPTPVRRNRADRIPSQPWRGSVTLRSSVNRRPSCTLEQSRETALLAPTGSVLGIAMSYGSRWPIMALRTMIQAGSPDWCPKAAAILCSAQCAAPRTPDSKRPACQLLP